MWSIPEAKETVPIKVTEKKGYTQTWSKTRKTMELLHAQYLHQFDWFFKADDDTYVIMDNLRRFLHRKNSSKLELYGKIMTNGLSKDGYPQGGAGYAFGRAALDKLVTVGFKTGPRCPNVNRSGHGDDAYIGVCFADSGVILAKDSLDSQGRELFHALNFSTEFFIRWDTKHPFYRQAYHKEAMRKCCSNESITFHYVKGRDQLLMDFIFRQFIKQSF